MDKMETMQVMWEKTTKEFEKMDNKEKTEWFNSLIDKVENNTAIKNLKDKWNNITDDQKLKIYEKDAMSFRGCLKRGSIYSPISSIVNGIKNIKTEWRKNAATYALLEKIPCRFLVELWILSKPEGLSEDALLKDVKKDAKNFNRYIWICETVCGLVPQARPVVPFLWLAKHYSKWYETNWTEVVISRLNGKKQLELKQQTNKELAEVMTDNQEPMKKAA